MQAESPVLQRLAPPQSGPGPTRYNVSVRLIFVSPHLDDAALSAGGLIHEQADLGNRVEIWTIMAGIPEIPVLSEFAREMHGKWGTTTVEDTLEVRKAEDRRAAELLGATAVHFSFPDAIYRRGMDGQNLYAEPVGTPLQAGDEGLAGRIAQELGLRLEPDDVVICPLALGAHVDHVIVRQAAEALNRPLRYVADLPYILYDPGALDAATMRMESRLFPISESGFDAWLDAVGLYASQLSTLYQSWGLLQEAMRQYWRAQGGLQLWSRTGAPAFPGLDSAPKS
jgi:LmbE family N-acetylglucosaminyl deacetylase